MSLTSFLERNYWFPARVRNDGRLKNIPSFQAFPSFRNDGNVREGMSVTCYVHIRSPLGVPQRQLTRWG